MTMDNFDHSAPLWDPIYNNAARPADPRYTGGGTLLWITLKLKPEHHESHHYTVNRFRWFVDAYVQQCCCENNYANSYNDCRDSSFRNDRAITGRHDDFNGHKICGTNEMDLMPSYKKSVEYWFPTHAQGWEWLQYTITFWKWVANKHPEMKINYQYWSEFWDGEITKEYALQWDSMWNRANADSAAAQDDSELLEEEEVIDERSSSWPVQVSKVPALQKTASKE